MFLYITEWRHSHKVTTQIKLWFRLNYGNCDATLNWNGENTPNIYLFTFTLQFDTEVCQRSYTSGFSATHFMEPDPQFFSESSRDRAKYHGNIHIPAVQLCGISESRKRPFFSAAQLEFLCLAPFPTHVCAGRS